MASGYSQVEHALWGDSAVRAMSNDARLLFIWSFSNGSCASLTGFTQVGSRRLRVVLWGEDNGKTEEDLAIIIDELAHKPLVSYDWDNELMWCRNRAAKISKSPKVITGAKNWMRTLPRSILLEQFYVMYPQLRET